LLKKMQDKSEDELQALLLPLVQKEESGS